MEDVVNATDCDNVSMTTKKDKMERRTRAASRRRHEDLGHEAPLPGHLSSAGPRPALSTPEGQ